MRRLLIASTVLALASIVPASAQAATLTFSQPCFRRRDRLAARPADPLHPDGRHARDCATRSSADFPGSLSTTEVRGFFDGAGNASGVFTSYNVPA